jgi:hypothetical protein
MGAIDFGLFVDESGEGRLFNPPRASDSKRCLWASAAVCVPWDSIAPLGVEIKALTKKNLTGNPPELKGFDLARQLRLGVTMDDVAKDVASAVKKVAAKIWIVVARPGAGDVPGLATIVQSISHRNPLPKDNARQLLLERVNGYAVPRYHPSGSWLLVWDLSEAQELKDFSRSIVEFRNLAAGYALHDAIVPALLGGLSHDWAPLQIADLYANFALNQRAEELGYHDATASKADAFRNHLRGTLATDASGKLVGWKTWG